MEGYEYANAEKIGELQDKANLATSNDERINGRMQVSENAGIAIRTIKEFFRMRTKIKDPMKKQFTFYVSFFQIYNERVYDLLNFN